MYCDFFGLRCRPFEDRADTQFCFAFADWEEAVAGTLYQVRHGRGMAVVWGEAGTGKTLLIRSLLQRLHASDHVVVLPWPPTPGTDLIREACKGFGVTLPESEHHIRCYTRLRRHLVRTAVKGHRSILIVDRAENLNTDNLTRLATLSELRHGGANLLNIALVGQPQLRSLLKGPKHARISERLSGERSLRPLTPAQTHAYVQHRLRVAGGGDAHLFTDEAVALIHEASKGIPGRINRVADAAMLGAYGAGESRVTGAIAAEAIGSKQPVHRTAMASDLGVSTPEQVAAGLTRERKAQMRPEQVTVRQTTEGSDPAVAGPADTQAPATGGGDEEARQRVDALRGQVSAVTASADEKVDELRATLDEATARTEQFNSEFIDTAIVHCKDRVEQALEDVELSQLETVEATQDKLDETAQQASSIAASTAESVNDLRNALDNAKSEAERVQAELTRIALDRLREEFQEQVEAHMRTQHEAMEAALCEHDAKLQRMRETLHEQLEAKTRTHQEAMERNIATHQATLGEMVADWKSQIATLEERIAGSRRNAEASVGRLTEQAAVATNELTPSIQRAETLLRDVQSAWGEIGAMQRGVATMLVEIGGAHERVDTMRGQVAKCEELTERFTAVRTSTQDITEELNELVGTARQLFEAMQNVVAHVDEKTGQLNSHHAAAAHLLQRLSAANVIGHSLAERVSEFIKQAQALERQVNRLQGEAKHVGERMGELTARPAEIVASAQTQAAELERVCAAVKKVFRGLSSATLAAQERSTTCQEITDSATVRLAELNKETDRAATTLHEWVEEALRVQSRLEKTLQECPSIRETHPGSTVRRMANVVGSATRIANPSAAELRMLSEPAAEPADQARVTKHTTRADEISKLIDEAKRAVSGAKT